MSYGCMKNSKILSSSINKDFLVNSNEMINSRLFALESSKKHLKQAEKGFSEKMKLIIKKTKKGKISKDVIN